MAKFLKSIYRLQFAFNTLSAEYTRTIEFGVLPTKEQADKLNKWFDQVMRVKKELYELIFKEFNTSTRNFLNRDKVTYKTFFKGSKLLPRLQKNKILITFEPVWEGLMTEITGTINSYITNHKKAFKSIQDDIDTINDSLKQNAEILTSLPRHDLLYQSITNLASDLENKTKQLKTLDYGDVVKNSGNIKLFSQRLNSFNSLSSSYNYNLNLLKQAYSKDDLKFIRTTQQLPEFPNSRSLEKSNNLDSFIIELDKLSKKDYSPKDLVSKLNVIYEKEKDKERWLKERLGKTQKKRSFASKLTYWFVNNQKGSIENKVKVYFQKLDSKIEKLNKQFLKNNDLPAFRQMVYLKARKARLVNSQATEKINEITSTLAMELLKGRTEIEEFILPGFSWKSKPSKNTALGFKNRLFCLFFSNTASDFKVGEGEIEFIKTKGGGRKKSRNEKSFERIKGDFDFKNDGLELPLHFGKSYARRFITNKNWGLWLDKPGVELNNGKIKRKRLHPKDNWHYYFDLTISSKRPFEKNFGQRVLSKARAVIGIDRGEKYPIAYVVKDTNERKILDEGLLGNDFIKRLETIEAKIKSYQEKGNRIPLELKNKKSNLKVASVTTFIGFLLEKAAEHKAIFSIEDLDRSFKGSENSLITKKTYVAVEDSLISALEFAGLVEKSRSKKSKNGYYGALLQIGKAGTSQTCPKCGTIWKKEYRELILNKVLNGKILINYSTGRFSLDGEKYKLAQKFIGYNTKKNLSEERTLEELKNSLGEKDLFKKLFIGWSGNMGLLGPRLSQEIFVCPKVSCGFEKNADLVGASNIADRGIESLQRILKSY